MKFQKPKKLLSLLIVFCMLFAMMPISAFAEETTESRTLYFDGTNLYTDENCTTPYTEQIGKWTVEASTNTLRLTKFNFTTSAQFAIWVKDVNGTANIVLYGANTLKSTFVSPGSGNDDNTAGINIDSPLIISGAGSLDLYSGKAIGRRSAGMMVWQNTEIKGGTITTHKSTTSTNDYGIFINSQYNCNLTLTDGMIIFEGKTAAMSKAPKYSYGCKTEVYGGLDADSTRLVSNPQDTTYTNYKVVKILPDTRTSLNNDNFTYTPPTSLSYDGEEKTATVVANSGIQCNEPTVKYYNSQGQLLSGAPINSGTYKVKIDVDGNDTYKPLSDSPVGQFTISPIDQDALSISSFPTYIRYGDTFTLTATGGSGTGAVRYTSSNEDVASVESSSGLVSVKGIGSFTITATKAGDKNHNESKVTTSSAYVYKRPLSVSGQTALDRTYDGSTDVTLTGGQLYGVMDGDDVSITMPATGKIDDKNVGTRKIVNYHIPELNGTKASYYYINSYSTIRVDITPRPVTITGVTAQDKTYDGTKTATILSKGTVDGAIVGDDVSVGEGTVQFDSADANESAPLTATEFKLSGADKDNYELSSQPTLTNAKIDKATLNVSINKVKIKSGEKIPSLTVNVTGFVNGEDENLVGFFKPTSSVLGYPDTTDTDLTSIDVALSGGNPTSNYKFEEFPTTAEIEIVGVDVTDDDFSLNFDNTLWQTSNTIFPKGNYNLISTDKTNWSSSLLLSKEGKTQVTFYLKNSTTGAITKGKTITTKIDKTAPQGDITFNENTVKKFINDITFGLLFNDFVDIKIASSDNLSGVKKTEWHLSETVLSQDEVDSISDWNSYISVISASGNDKEKFIMYVRIIDNAGNVTIFGSNGATFDKLKPVISGAENEKSYCISREISVSDDNLDKVTLNGNEVTLNNGKFTVSPKDGAQTIVATDKAGNTSTLSLTVYADHSWDNGVITKEPTLTSEGVKTYTCKICGETKTEVIPKLAPIIIEGANGSITQGIQTGITFRSNAPLKDFLNVLVDGSVISGENYTTAEGSTIVNLKPEYLETLSVGKHTIDVKSVGGTASTEFTIISKSADDTVKSEDTVNKDDTVITEDTSKKEDTNATEKTESPKTNDNTNMLILVCLLFVTGGAITTITVAKKRKSHSKN